MPEMPGLVESEPLVAVESPPPTVEPPIDNTPPRSYVVLHQTVELEIDFREQCIQGQSHILFGPTAPISEVPEIFIDARQCEIDVKKITVSNCEVEASYRDPCDFARTPESYKWSAPQWGVRKDRMHPLLHHRRKEVSALDHDFHCCAPLDGSIRVKLPSADEVIKKNRDSLKSAQQDLLLNSDGTVGGYRISIPFKLRNVQDGLQFVGVDEADLRYPHVYTRHSVEPGTASSIFPCIDDPGSRNSWKISITCPRTLGDAFQQALATQQQYKGTAAAIDSQKRKHGEEEPRRREYRLTEEDKLLEMTVVCSGYLTGEVINKDDETKKTMTFEIDKNKAAKHIGFAVGPFEHVDLWSEFRSEEDDTRLGVSAAKVHGYCLPGRAELVRNTCAALVTAVDHFVLHFGRYPFESYKVCFVDDMVEESISLCAFSMCSNRLLYPEEIVDTEIETTRTLVYSLASQWFGVNIVPNMKSDIWLVVGIAWFMTDYFMKTLCGNNAFRFRVKTMADRLVDIDMRRPSLQDLGEHLYLGSFEVDFLNLKAPLVLFILDRRLSKSSGSAGISRIISRMVSKANTSGQASDEVLGSEAFRKACEKVGSTRLESFWNQWVVGSGCPRFDVHQRFNKKRLCVEMTVRQIQDTVASTTRPINKDDFWRDVREDTHAVYEGEMQHAFTGPMTIRIHEADGTPYEHIVEIREESAKTVKFEIPYNTKYKRLKRNRRNRERALANNLKANNEDGGKELYYLGDVMQQADDVEEWDFREWDEETEHKMDQESYEWIRMDADFEWLCEIQTNLPPYMYASQLQQDRDVAAQQDSMLYLHRSYEKSGPHPLVSTILCRTLLDPRYFYGIRVMAAEELPRHAAQDQVDWIGLRHLTKAFQYFFCYPGTYTPRPNNFADKRQYMVQSAIPGAVARIRDNNGKCPKEARRFILEQLQANNNTENVYSDQMYICKLIKALALCQVADESKAKPQMAMSMSFGDGDEDELIAEAEAVDTEPEEFTEAALAEIERYRRMDEFSPSFQNCFTVAALDALCIMMKAKVIPTAPGTFVQYLQDRNCDVVRIQACEALVELDFLAHPAFLRLFLILVGTDPSPFVRDKLFKALCRGLASIAIGENAEAGKQTPPESNEDDLIVEQDNEIIDARKKAKARKEDLAVALAALKEETTDDEHLQEAIWKTMDSPVLTVAERINMLELCSLLVEEDQSLLLKFNYPVYWTARRGERIRGQKCLIHFNRHFRTKPRKIFASPPAPPKPEPKRTITLNLNRNASISKIVVPVASQPLPAPAPLPATVAAAANLPAKPSVTVTAPKPALITPNQVVIPPRTSVSVAKPRAATPRAATPAASQEKAAEKTVKKSEPHRDSISTGKKNKSESHRDSISAGKKSEFRRNSISAGKKGEAHRDNVSAAKKGEAHRDSVSAVKRSSSHRDSLSAAKKGEPQWDSISAVKKSETNRDSISVQGSVRPTIELQQSGFKPSPPPKVNGNGNLAPANLSRPPKRASTESEGPRPTKMVKLDTSKIRNRLPSRLSGSSTGPSRKLVTVKFKDWDKLRHQKGTVGTPESASIRATPKHAKAEKPSISASQPTAARPPPGAAGFGPVSSSPILSSQKSSTPIPASQPMAQPPSGGSGKPRKPLPEMRKPLPSAGSNGQPAPTNNHSPTSPPAPKAPSTKVKIKVKTKPIP